MHLLRDQVARVCGLLADALSRTKRLRAPADDLQKICWGPQAAAASAAGLHAAPLLLEPLCHAQRLAATVLATTRTTGSGGTAARQRAEDGSSSARMI